mmetsp:Transcript_21445/g.41945  ORF Transcript_21445/g.41945 Transcript_21445/m.41945 type:complete len:554 (+) Transcript_21445:32-1693(+)
MGRLRCAVGNDDATCCPKDTSDAARPERRLADAFEEWRYRPDLCLMWVAFCKESTLTLADGVSFAKTQRSSCEVLQLLEGVGLATSEPDTAASKETLVTSRDNSGSQVWWESETRDDAPAAAAAESRSRWSEEAAAAAALRSAQCWSGECPATTERPSQSSSTSRSSQSPALPLVLGDSGSVPAIGDFSDGSFKRCVEVNHRPWASGDFAVVAKVPKSVHGEVRYLRAADGTKVVAKTAPADSDLETEPYMDGASGERQAWLRGGEGPKVVGDLWNEMAALTYLQRSRDQCPFVIQLLGTFRDGFGCGYLLIEYCEGGDLFERAAYGAPLTEAEKKRYISQILQAVQHLHRHNVGHRDISLENVLLRKGDCVLMDFSQAVRLHAADSKPLRYFAEAGKRMYRAPEMYVPVERRVQVNCPHDSMPGAVAQVSYNRCWCEVILPSDAIPLQPCVAEPHGYAAAPADIFACGVTAFVLLIGKPPWSVAQDLDPTFSFIRRHGVPNLLHQWRGGGFCRPGTAPSDDERLLARMLKVNPVERISLEECLHNPWLSGVV